MSTNSHATLFLYEGTYFNSIKLRMCNVLYFVSVLKIYFRTALVVYGFRLRKEKECFIRVTEGRTLNVQYLQSYESSTLDKMAIHERIREEHC